MFAGRYKSGIAVDSILLTVIRFATIGLSIFTTMLLSKKYSLADYGTYSQAIIIISIGGSFAILGLTDAVNYYYNSTENQEIREKYISTMFTIQYIVGAICAAIILVFQQFITEYFKNPDLVYLYIYIAFTPLITNLQSMYQVMFVSIGKAKIIGLRNLIVSILKLGVIAIACLVTKSIVTIFVALIIMDIMQLLFFVIYFNKHAFIIRLKNTRLSLVPQILKYSIPMAGYILTNSLFRDTDKLVISRLTDIETLAIYSNCSKVLPFDLLTIAFATVLLPYITKYISLEQHEKSQHLFSRYLRFSYITTWIIAFGAIITAPEFITFLYGSKYSPGLWVFILFIVVDMVRFANVSIILSAKGKTKTLMLYAIFSLVANLVLSITFFYLWGSLGPAISTLLITLVSNVLLLLHGAKIINTSMSKLFDFKAMGLFILELMFVSGVALFVRLFLNNYSIGNMWVLIISYGVFVLGMSLFNIKKIVLLAKEMNNIKLKES